MTNTECQNKASKNFKLFEVVKLRTKEDLEKLQMIDRMSYKNYLGEKVMIVKILKEVIFNFYGVTLGGQVYFEIKTKDKTTFLIEPSQLEEIR